MCCHAFLFVPAAAGRARAIFVIVQPVPLGVEVQRTFDRPQERAEQRELEAYGRARQSEAESACTEPQSSCRGSRK